MISVDDIKQLTHSLGTVEGLYRVSSEIDRLRTAIAENQLTISSQELSAFKAALDRLSAAILAMHQVARCILAESGAVISYVG